MLSYFLYMVGKVGIEPTVWQIQSLLCYHYTTFHYNLNGTPNRTWTCTPLLTVAFETTVSTIPPLEHVFESLIKKIGVTTRIVIVTNAARNWTIASLQNRTHASYYYHTSDMLTLYYLRFIIHFRSFICLTNLCFENC